MYIAIIDTELNELINLSIISYEGRLKSSEPDPEEVLQNH